MYNVYFYEDCEPLKIKVHSIADARKHAEFYIYQWGLNTGIEKIEKVKDEEK